MLCNESQFPLVLSRSRVNRDRRDKAENYFYSSFWRKFKCRVTLTVNNKLVTLIVTMTAKQYLQCIIYLVLSFAR